MWRRGGPRAPFAPSGRPEARRHLRAVAVALLTGDTGGYRFVPTLPRQPGSTDTYGSTHRGDDAA